MWDDIAIIQGLPLTLSPVCILSGFYKTVRAPGLGLGRLVASAIRKSVTSYLGARVVVLKRLSTIFTRYD